MKRGESAAPQRIPRAKPRHEAVAPTYPEIRAAQSVALLKALHILTADGRMNQDSRRKLKQVYHLVQFIEPLLADIVALRGEIRLVDHGAGKSYLGFILYDLFFKTLAVDHHVFGIETRADLVEKSRMLATTLGFQHMSFLNLSVEASLTAPEIVGEIDVVTALHACNTATDDAIAFALAKRAKHIVLVPCCQADIAGVFRKNKADDLAGNPLTELWRRPVHTREFASHITNVLRCLQLEAHGYQVTATELVGWEHAMKNELIIATDKKLPGKKAAVRLEEMLATFGLGEMRARFLGGVAR